MGNSTLIRTTLLIALIAAFGFAATGYAPAQDQRTPTVIQLVSGDATSRFISLGLGKSVVIDLPRDIKDVLVADPATANAFVRSARRAYIIGVKVGQTNIYFFDADGKQIAGFDIAVKRDLNGMRAALKQMIPDADIRIEGVGQDGIMLSGSAASPLESQQAYDLASRLVGDGAKVVNGITVRGRDQVMLKVTVAEVSRNVIKQFGVDLSGSFGYGSSVINFNTTNPFPLNGSPASELTAAFHNNSVIANIRAMEQTGAIHILAEPNLTAISGETAQFLAGGKFPYPTPPQQAGGAPGFEFQNFGVNLMFTPVVLSEGRISLKVKTEVSELSPETSVTVSGTTVPGLKVRSANTTVEIPSGGSLAMAGMIQQETKHTISGIPGVAQLPILGTLFRSRDYLNNQTELMILVTPYIVRAVAQKQLSRPDDGFADPNDPQSDLLGRLNRIYGAAGKTELPHEYHGKYGFILD
jgi:pilus assembly protein CpaC